MADKNLELKYILATHSHFDHVMGIPEIMEKYPDVKVCMSKQAYEDMLIQKEWGIQNFGEEWIETMEADPGTKNMLRLIL